MLEEPYCLFPNPDVYFDNKPTIQKKAHILWKLKGWSLMAVDNEQEKN